MGTDVGVDTVQRVGCALNDGIVFAGFDADVAHWVVGFQMIIIYNIGNIIMTAKVGNAMRVKGIVKRF